VLNGQNRRQELIEKLTERFNECVDDSWNGHNDCQAANILSYNYCYELLLVLKEELLPSEIYISPSGFMGFAWYDNPNRDFMYFSIMANHNGLISCIGSSNKGTKEDFREIIKFSLVCHLELEKMINFCRLGLGKPGSIRDDTGCN